MLALVLSKEHVDLPKGFESLSQLVEIFFPETVKSGKVNFHFIKKVNFCEKPFHSILRSRGGQKIFISNGRNSFFLKQRGRSFFLFWLR